MNYLTKLFVAMLMASAMMVTSVAVAAAPAPQPSATKPIATSSQLPKEQDLNQKIEAVAKKYGVSASLIRAIVGCESSFRTDAVGDGGTSYGLVQIHLPAHPTITINQAQDPDFALDFLASNLAQGKGYMWSCYYLVQH